MNIGRKLYAANRREWRSWLAKNHRHAKEIWLIYYKKESGMPRIPYNDAVEEALCYGWIDSTLKPIDAKRFAQRFSPRRPRSFLSEMNKERVRRLIASRKMTNAGLEVISHHLDEPAVSPGKTRVKVFVLPEDILEELRATPEVWKTFSKFPDSYKRIRIGWIDAARHRPAIFRQRLDYFIHMTAKKKRFGMVQ
jgi:uncharacterized protein YdeI (YjbR/CyaY-like superfamily)